MRRVLIVIVSMWVMVNVTSCTDSTLASNPLELAIQGLNREDTAQWWVHEVFDLSDQQKVILAGSGDTSVCHSCGPRVALVLVVRDSLNAPWELKAIARDLPVISSWGNLPRFELLNNGSSPILMNTSCYGNQGNEECTLSLFDLGYCDFGVRNYIYSYRSALDCVVSDSIARHYVPDLPSGLAFFGLTMHKEVVIRPDREEESRLVIKTSNHVISVIHPTIDTLVWNVNMPLDSSLITRYLCAWGPNKALLCR